MLDVLSERITPFLARAGYEGDVQFRPNPELGPHDAIVEWAGGKAERHTETMWQEIELMINQLSLAQPSTPRE